jgi:L-ascorbate metabolism protein UlaG (beta-lactamase superfamily)
MRVKSLGHSAFSLEVAGLVILIDPWLTERLDRFWTRWPAGAAPELPGDANIILISHHHCDHLHPESLLRLPKSATVIYPEPERRPVYCGSGMGYKAIPWVLSRLGFSKKRAISPLTRLSVQGIAITALPSKVFFPEFAFLIETPDGNVFFGGDSLLHPATEKYLCDHMPLVSVAFIPCHSTSPFAPLFLRQKETQPEVFVQRSRHNFRRHVETLNAALTIPSSFGWKVDSTDCADRFAWANSHLFPLTPDQALALLHEMKKPALLLAPGDEIEITGGQARNVSSVQAAYPDDSQANYRQHHLSASAPIPAFSPGSYSEGEPSSDPHLALDQLLEELVGTYYWSRAAQTERVAYIRLSDGRIYDETFVLDVAHRQFRGADLPAMDQTPFTWMHPETLNALAGSRLLLASSFGRWLTNDNLLSSVFHHPRYYIRYIDRMLETTSTSSSTARSYSPAMA